jgi:predicted transcriptional regulator
MHKRGWGAITVDILEATLKPEKKMRIMYKANLNFERFNKYFYELIGKGLIEERDGSNGKPCYVISERGKTLLACLRKARELFSAGED